MKYLHQVPKIAAQAKCLCGNYLSYSRRKFRLHQMRPSFGNLPEVVSVNYEQRCGMATELSSDELSMRVTVSQMTRFLKEQTLAFENGPTSLHLNCPFCYHLEYPNFPQKIPGVVYINKTTGMFICFACKRTGLWHVFEDALTRMKQQIVGNKPLQLLSAKPDFFIQESVRDTFRSLFQQATPLDVVPKNQFLSLLRKFRLKCLLPGILGKFNVRVTKDQNEILFPLHDHQKELCGFQILHADQLMMPDNQELFFYQNKPQHNVVAIFSCLTKSSKSKEVVLTATPSDAIAVTQETDIPAISFPSATKTLPPEILPLLEKYQKIIIWFGNTINDWEAAKTFARKLGEKRCHFIRPRDDRPAGLMALQRGLNLVNILSEAHPIAHKSITTFQSLRQDIYDELNHVEQVSGIKWKRYLGLTKLLKGHRKGELTVLTGPTGSGKTTFMSEYSLDLCVQGVNTLWGSFEIKNVRLGKIMLTQFAMMPLDKHLDKYDYWADKFERIPLYFMTFHGQQSSRQVLDAMSHAVYFHDIQHVVVDNVQFMLGADHTSSRLDRFLRQDILLSAFRRFATQHNCHVTLVMHPRKEKLDELSNSSIFGGAKASQEADNILILQDKRLTMLRGKKYIQVTKNRFDGDLGIVPLDFDKESLTFSIKRSRKKDSTPKS